MNPALRARTAPLLRQPVPHNPAFRTRPGMNHLSARHNAGAHNAGASALKFNEPANLVSGFFPAFSTAGTRRLRQA